MRIKVTKSFRYKGTEYEEGETVDLPDSVAESTVEKGYAEEAEESEEEGNEPPELEMGEEEPGDEENASESAGGTDVEEFMKSGGGWLTADDVEEGDTITIQGPGEIDEETFDRPYLNVPVMYDDAEYNLRLGKRNTKRIADEYGKDTGNWVGKEIRVVSIEDYPQLGSKGMILKTRVRDTRPSAGLRLTMGVTDESVPIPLQNRFKPEG